MDTVQAVLEVVLVTIFSLESGSPNDDRQAQLTGATGGALLYTFSAITGFNRVNDCLTAQAVDTRPRPRVGTRKQQQSEEAEEEAAVQERLRQQQAEAAAAAKAAGEAAGAARRPDGGQPSPGGQ